MITDRITGENDRIRRELQQLEGEEEELELGIEFSESITA
jgi:hypothetical protein